MMFDEEAKIFVEYERKATPGHWPVSGTVDQVITYIIQQDNPRDFRDDPSPRPQRWSSRDDLQGHNWQSRSGTICR
jgi:hypothetical protein